MKFKKGNKCNWDFSKTNYFQKGQRAWNAGISPTKKTRAKMSKNGRGVTRPKPVNFSDTMRKVKPPMGKKMKFDSRDKEKRLRVWRKGYVFLYKPNHPASRKVPPDYGYVREHTMVIVDSIKRLTKKEEVVHHIDGDKSNNELENLLLCPTQREHNRVHTKMEIFVEKLIREGKVYYDREKKEFLFR